MDWLSDARELLVPIALVVAWFVLMRFVLPRFGVST